MKERFTSDNSMESSYSYTYVFICSISCLESVTLGGELFPCIIAFRLP